MNWLGWTATAVAAAGVGGAGFFVILGMSCAFALARPFEDRKGPPPRS